MINPLISVIIPIYRAEQYIKKCVDSVINQTYTNLEIILIDDGSPDNCPSICDDYASVDNRIRVIHKENNGVSAARNTGMQVISGEYVTFVDADDWIDEDYIDVLYNGIIKNEADVACVGFYYEYLDGDTELLVEENAVFKENIVLEYLYDNIRPEVCSKLYSRKVIESFIFDTECNYSEDVLLNYYVCKKCDTLVVLNVAKYHYLQQSGYSSTTPYITDIRANSYKVYVKFVEDSVGTENYEAAIWRLSRSVVSILSRVIAVDEFRNRYYDEIANCFIRYAFDIVKNKKVPLKNKAIALSIKMNKNLFKRIVLLHRQ